MKNKWHLWLRKIGIAACTFGAIGVQAQNGVANNDAVEFDGSMLKQQKGTVEVDLSRFRFGNPIMAGTYQAHVFVNGSLRGETNLRFIDVPEKPMAGLCFDEAWLPFLDVQPKARMKAVADASGCTKAIEVFPQLTFSFDPSALRLDVSIPQALTVQRPPGYVLPSQWHNGVPAAFVRYRANHYQTRTKTQSRHDSQYFGLDVGANFGGWAFRHDGSLNRRNGKADSYRRHSTHISRDIDVLRSRLTAGDFYAFSPVQSGFGVRGIGLASDKRMSTDTHGSFAPVVRGFADSNATVRIRQNGNVIYETTVPAGLFALNDVYPGSSGDLDVEITEESGKVRRFGIPYSPSARLLSPGSFEFQTVLGRYRDGERVFKTPVWQGGLQYGLNNYLTLRGGATLSRRYREGVLGTVWNTPAGAIEGSILFSQFTPPQANTLKSSTLHLGFNKNFSKTGTHFNVDWWRHQSPHGYSLRDAAAADSGIWQADNPAHKVTSRLSVSLNQKLGQKLGAIYVSGNSSRLQGSKRLYNEYQLGYSNHFKNLQYHIGYSQARGKTKRSDNRWFVNLSLPFDLGGSRNAWMSASHQRDTQGGSYSRASLSGRVDDNKWGYGVSVSHGSQTAYSAHTDYRTPFAKLAASTGGSKNSRQWSVSTSGAVVVHPHGVTATPELGDTFAVVHAKGAHGAVVNNASGTRVDRFGNGIIPHLTPYRRNRVSINPEHLSDKVELLSTGEEVIPRANTIQLVRFATNVGTPVLFTLREGQGGIMPPLAAEALDRNGQTFGYVVQGGRLFVRGLEAAGNLDVVWGVASNQRCRITYRLPDTSSQSDMIQQTVDCLPY